MQWSLGLPQYYLPNIEFDIYSIFQKVRMGCQHSALQHQNIVRRAQTLSTQQEVELGVEKIINRQRGDPHQLYHFSKVIWRGRATVRKVLERNSRIERACKILSANKQVNLFSSFQQVEILKKLNHPNIVQIIEYFSQPKFLYIVMEHVPGLSLHEMYYLQEMRNLQIIVEIVKQILIALKFCHDQGYYHKSINPEHVMVVKLEKNKSYLVKLVGFGRALRAGAHKLRKKFSQEDPIFTPPELDNERYADKQDIWGCGVIFLELFSGQRKFANFLETKEIIVKDLLKKQSMPEDHKELIMDFLSKILEVSPEKRISVDEALKHGIFSMNYPKTIYIRQKNLQVINRLVQFRVQNNLKSLFHMYVSLNILSVEEKSQYLLEFYNLDKNKDGKIDFQQLVEGLSNAFEIDRQTASQKVSKIFKQCNKSQEHYLQFHEFVAATTLASKDFYQHKLDKLFSELDQNKDGKITIDQLERAIQGIHCSQLLSNYKNSEITISDFRLLLRDLFEEENG